MRKLMAILAIILIAGLVFNVVVYAAGEKEAKAEKEAAWRIPGWQTIFAVAAILYYIGFSLNILPKIIGKDEEVGH